MIIKVWIYYFFRTWKGWGRLVRFTPWLQATPAITSSLEV
jgi:hypothetical protein